MAQLGEDNWDSQKTSSDNDTKLKTLVPFQFSPAIPYDETFELLEREQPQVSFEPQWLKRNQENTLTGGKPYNVSKVWPAAKYQYTKEELLTLFKPTEFSEDSSLNSFLTLVTKECTPPFNLLPIEQQEESINKINASAGRGRFPNSRGFVNRSMSSDSAITNNAPTSPFSNNNNNRGRGRGRGRPDMNNMNNNNNNNAFTNSPLSFSSDRIQDNNNNRYKHPWSDRQQRGDNNNNNNNNIKTTPMRHPTRTGNTNDSWGSNSNNKGPLFDRSGGNQFKRENKIRRPLKELLWLYRDPQGEIQGPFTDSEMNEWFEAGYFTPNLLIKRVYQSYFVELSTLPLDLNLSPFFTLDDDILTPSSSSSSSSTTSDINDSSTIIKQNDVDSDSVIDDLHLNKPNYNKNNNNNKDNVTTPTTKSQSLVNIEIIGQVHNTTPLLKNSNIIISNNNNNNSNNSVPITHSVSSPVVLTTSSSIATANANINNIAINNNVTGVANSNNSTTVTNSNINIKEQDPAIIAASPAQIHMMLLRQQQQQQQMAMGMGMGMNPQMMNQHIPHDIIPPHHIIHQHHDVHIAENELLNERFGFINPNPMQHIPIPMQQQQQQMVNNTTGTAVQPPLNAWHRPPVVLPYQPVQPLLPNNNNNPTTSTANTVAPPNNNTNVNNPIAQQQQQQQYPLKRNQGVFLLDESGMIRNVPSAPVPLPTTTATPVVNPINTSNSSIPISSPVQESTNSNTQQPQEEEEFFWQTDNNTTATTHGNAVEVNNPTENKVEKTWNQKPQKQEPVSIKAIQDQEKQEKQKKQKQQTNQVQSPNKPITPQAQQAATIPINNSNSGNVGWNNTTNTSSTKTLREIQEEEKRQSEIARLEKQKQQEQNAKLKKAKEDKERIVPLSSTGGWSSTNATGVNTNVANNNNETPILSLREIQEQEKQQLKKQREMEAKQEMKKQVQQQTQNTQPRWGAGWTANDNKKPTLREIQEEELKHKTTDAPTPIPLNKTQEIAPPLTWANQPKPVPEPIPSANTPVTNITNNNNKNKKSPMKKESELPTKKEAPKQQQKQATPTKTSKKEEKKPVATAWGATQSSNQSKSLKDIQQEELQKATALNTTVTPPVVENKDKDAYFWDIPEEDHKTNVTPAPSTTPRKSNATDNKDFPALQASKKNTNVVASQPAVVSQTQTTKAEQSKQKKKKNQKLPASLLGFTVYNPNQGEIETLED